MENGLHEDEYTDAMSAKNLTEHVEYFEYEDNISTGYEHESLIEYIEEDDVQNGDYVENENLEEHVKTHTLSVKHLQFDGQSQEIYRCLECAIDFVTLEDFTKVHQEMQKKVSNKASTNNSTNDRLQNEQVKEEQIIQNSNGSWLIIKEEQIIVDESETKELDNYLETSEDIIEHRNFVKENNDIATDTLLHVKEEKQTITDDEDDGEKYFCCDCQLVFSDLEKAEQHVCSAINTTTVKQEEADNIVEQEEYDNDIRLYVEEQKQTLDPSKKSQSKEVQHHCAECDKTFNSLQGLQIHNRIHKTKDTKTQSDSFSVVELKKPTCPICNTNFSSYKNLKYAYIVIKCKILLTTNSLGYT
uniref:C2H2-type domain-containing protein n=1 Tax=Bactrocera latifrons TaxID=174628 RepID=A0A0K8VW22_BACLA